MSRVSAIGVRLVLDVDRHVEHFGDALARRHGALHDAEYCMVSERIGSKKRWM